MIERRTIRQLSNAERDQILEQYLSDGIAIDKARIAGLVEALRSILGWRELRSGNDFPVERIEEIARNALATYRNQGENQ